MLHYFGSNPNILNKLFYMRFITAILCSFYYSAQYTVGRSPTSFYTHSQISPFTQLWQAVWTLPLMCCNPKTTQINKNKHALISHVLTVCSVCRDKENLLPNCCVQTRVQPLVSVKSEFSTVKFKSCTISY